MAIRCLTQLFTHTGLLRDGDGDGLPDGFGCRFSVGRNPGAIDVAARLGLESAAFTPGLTEPGAAGVPVWFGPENPEAPAVEGLELEPGQGLVAVAGEGVVVTGATPEDGWQAARWLAHTYPLVSPGGRLLAEVAGGRQVRAVVLRDAVVQRLLFGPEAPALSGPETVEAVGGDKPTEIGAPEPPPFAAPVPGDLPPPGPARLFTVAGLMGSSDGVQHDRTGWQVVVGPETSPEELAALCELAARTGVEATGLRFPFAVAAPGAGADGVPRVILAGEPPADPVWQDGNLAWTEQGLIAFGAPEERAAALRSAAAGAGLVDGLHATLLTRRAALPERPLERGEPLFDIMLEPEWEVDRFRRAWAEQVLPQVDPGKPVEVDLRLSEPLAVREALAEEIARSLAEVGVPEARIRVLSAYKQGFSWLEEEVLPRLKEAGPLAKVTVSCRPFEAPGAPAGSPQPEAREALGAGAAPPSGSGGDLRGPEGVTRTGEPLEMVIRWLQELYPADELLAAELPGVSVTFDLAAEPQPNVYELKAYRPDGSVAFAEGFSPVHSARVYLPEFPERGRVHPPTGLLRVEQGGRVLVESAIDTDAEAFWTAYQAEVLPRLRRYLTDTYGDALDPADQPFFGALMVEVALSEENRRLGIREEQISPLDALHEDLYFYTLDYLNELGLSLSGKPCPAPGAVEPWVVQGDGRPRARIRLYGRPEATGPQEAGLPEKPAELPAPAPAIPMDQVIGPDQLPPLLAYLAGLPGVRVWRTGLSFGGRPTWALSVTAPTAGKITPPQKLSAWRPTLLVNARHHANEISSTNSILKLAEMAARQGLVQRINLVLSPMENVDGAALHYAMQEAQPHWKLHAARFNAAGVDFGFDCFAPEPRFGESRTLPTLWRAYLPDVVLDDHGYPSHEWVQPFSGYSSAPYFRTSWWMPNALIYGIHRWMDPERFLANAAVQEALRDALAARLTADEEIEGYTRTLMDRYIRYGQRYVPEKFPLQTHKGFVSLTVDVAAGPDARSFVGRFPHITAAELITEVPDETAQGDYLALCARAHLEGDLAVIDVLTRHPQPVVRRRWEEDGAIFWTVGRPRPFRVATQPGEGTAADG